MPSTATQFITTLKRSGLVGPLQLGRVHARLSAGKAPLELAEELAKQGVLTAWQAQQLLSGRHAFFLGRYKLLEQLGGGGMGVVFKAHHATTGRVVALKIMAKSLLDHPAGLIRFKREVRVAAALNHPNIIIAFDAGCVRDTHFLVMEYGKGRDLRAWIKEFGQLPLSWSCECARQTALGLQHAHERGLVHRDIKPENLLVDVDPKTGRPLLKILDMGLARRVDDARDLDRAPIGPMEEPGEAGLTRAGLVLGTPDYIAPEQTNGTRAADIRSDIFSLGCTLFKLLTGEVPFPGEDATEKLVARVTLDAVRLRCLRSDLPEGLDDVLARMLARDPADRYQTPADVIAALTPYVMDECGSWNQASIFGAPLASEAPLGLQPDRTPVSFLSQLASNADAVDPNGSGLILDARRRRRGQSAARMRWLVGGALLIAISTVAAAAAIVAMYGNQSRSAVLELSWPMGERREAWLDVDERRVPLSPTNPAEIELEPGRRRIYVQRRGFEPIAWNIEIEHGQRLRRVVHWKKQNPATRLERH